MSRRIATAFTGSDLRPNWSKTGTGYQLLPEISATFEWIRLAQRVPVRIHRVNLPDEVKLRVGTTASVVVLTGTHDGDEKDGVPAMPRPLQ